MSSLIESSLFSTGGVDETPVFYRTRKFFGRKHWYFRRFEDVQYILSNYKLFANHRAKISMNWLERLYEAYESSQSTFIKESLVYIDPPDHTRIRRVINKAFTSESIKSLESTIQEVVDAILDDLAKKDGGDIMSEFAYPLTIKVLTTLLGFPETESHRLLQVSKKLKRPQDHLKGYIFFNRFKRQVQKIYAMRIAEPQDGLITIMVEAEKSGLINYEEAIYSLYLIILAGFETTANFIGNAIMALLLHPEDMNKIHIRAAITEGEIEELLRYCNILSTPHARWATADTKVGGVEVKRGEKLNVLLIPTNRDPSVFENANHLDLERADNPHMTFGYGIHFCVGAPLARAEGKIALGALIARFPKLRLAVALEELSKIPEWAVGGLEKLPVRWD